MGQEFVRNDSEQTEKLTEEQREIVTRPPDARVLVNAGAGTGKTRVLVERLAQLVAEHGLYPGSDILVLSFSRAVVAEVRRRLRTSGNAASYAGAATFDSFATQLLGLVDADGSWSAGSYEKRMAAAVAAIREKPEAAEHLRTYRHVLIDEIQDLVGSRADLVTEILSRCDSGFTLLGDRAQSIYDYQGDGDDNSTTSERLYAYVREHFADTLEELTLSKNFRALDENPRRVLSFGPRLQSRDGDAVAIRHDLDSLILSLPPVGDLSSVIVGWKKHPPQSDAVLCRDNGQALLVMSRLVECGIAARLKSLSVFRAAPSWIASSVLGFDSIHIGKRSMADRLEALATNNICLTPEMMWQLLKRTCPRRGNDLDLRKLAVRIANRSLPQELYEEDDRGVLISTIHRAKGLEFDRVFIIKPKLASDEKNIAEANRVIYVGLTRARRWLGVMDSPRSDYVRLDQRTQRWQKIVYRGRNPSVMAFELKSDDVDRTTPTMPGDKVGSDTAYNRQVYLRDSVTRGDIVVLRRAETVTTDPDYLVEHNGRAIGKMSSKLNRCIAEISRGELPDCIGGFHIDLVESVAGNPEETRNFGLGGAGLWLSPRIVGWAKVS